MSYQAPTGPKTAKGWIQEAAKRMLLNNLDAEVAEKPEELIVYGGRGKAARSLKDLQRILNVLERLENDETLLVQSGRAVGVFKTQPLAPRVIIANSNLVPKWATWEEFDRLDKLGLMMYGQMTAGSWIYIGTQGILQGTYETFAAAARKHFGGSLQGTITVTGGLGGMGGAQPLSVTLNGGVAICVEVDPERIQRRLDTAYLDVRADSLEEALKLAAEAKKKGEVLSIGLLGNTAEILPQMVRIGFTPELVTDQTSAHDPMYGYIPILHADEDPNTLRKADPQGYKNRVLHDMATHCQAMVEMQKAGAIAFDYGNNLRAFAQMGGFAEAFSYPGFVPAFIRDQFCQGRGPFRWVALSGKPQDIYKTDQAMMKLFSQDQGLHRWLTEGVKKFKFQGLPARICWVGYRERDKAGLMFNEMVARGELEAPIVIGRDHLDSGSVASPYRETEAMLDTSDAVADWPILNFALNAVSGAAWVSFHHGGGVGMGYSLHAGQVSVADGSEEAAYRLERVLTSDPGTGVMRHAHAGYPEAKQIARERNLDLVGWEA